MGKIKEFFKELLEQIELRFFYRGEHRVCSECKKRMIEGYCIESGFAYFCTDKCLEKNMTRKEFLELFNDGYGDTYWTAWYE